MRKILTITAIIICAISCGHPSTKTESKTLDQLRRDLLEVMLDSTSSWKQVTDAVYPFTDSLTVAAADENNLRNRMFGQQWGYMVIEYMADKYAELNAAGKDADFDDVSKILGRIEDVMMLWFYDPSEQLPHIWRDHYYVCHQHSDEPTDGYFHLMVTIPTEVLPEPTLRIFYPDSGEGSPAIVFTKFKGDGSTEEDEESFDPVPLDNWAEKNSVEEGYPMFAIGDASVVEKMLQYDVAYLLFESGISENGAPGEPEFARLELRPFQEKWKEIVK